MPIELHHEHDAIYRLDLSGRLSRSEYGACEAQVADVLRQRGSIKLLCVLHAFEGWDQKCTDSGITALHGRAMGVPNHRSFLLPVRFLHFSDEKRTNLEYKTCIKFAS